MSPRPGTQELRFLTYVAQHGPITVGEVNAALGAELGLARTTEARTDRDLTHSGVTLGTFDYISPEQALDPRRAETERPSGPLVDEDDVVVTVGSDNAFDHRVEDCGRLGLLLLEIADLLPEAPGHDIE